MMTRFVAAVGALLLLFVAPAVAVGARARSPARSSRLRIGEVADALERSGVVNRAAFINYVEHPPTSSIAGAWPVPAGHSLEGYLFPDSYRFERNTPASDVARQMVDDFNRRVSTDLRT